MQYVIPLAVGWVILSTFVVLRKATGTGKKGGEVTTREAAMRQALKR